MLCPSTRIVVIVVSMAILSPLAGLSRPAVAETAEAKKAIVRQVIEEVLNQGRLDRADELVAEGEGDFGPDWFRVTYRTRRTAFPDLTYRIEEMIAEGDRVVVRFTAVGTPNGPVVPVASVTPVEVSGVAIMEVKNGQVTAGWELTDMLKLAKETGYSLRAPEVEETAPSPLD